MFVCVHTRPPPTPFPKQGSQCMSAFLSSFGVYTRDDVYVRCVACEFPAYVECVLLAALAPQLGLARRVGRGPWWRARSLAGAGWSSFLVTIGEGLVAAPWELVLGLGVSPGQELLAPCLRWGGELQPDQLWNKALPSPLLGGSGFWGSTWHGEGAEPLCRTQLLFHLPVLFASWPWHEISPV